MSQTASHTTTNRPRFSMFKHADDLSLIAAARAVCVPAQRYRGAARPVCAVRPADGAPACDGEDCTGLTSSLANDCAAIRGTARVEIRPSCRSAK